MATRTFKQTGTELADTDTPISVVVTLDNQEVFNGALPVSAAPADLDAITNHVVLFTWQQDTSEHGVYNMVITVTGGTLILGRTMCNYSADERDGANDFGAVNMIDRSGVLYQEPFSNVVIDGEPKERFWEETLMGQWGWTVSSSFSADFTVPPVRSFE
jgi:hypothetical protein